MLVNLDEDSVATSYYVQLSMSNNKFSLTELLLSIRESSFDNVLA
jgi:hypothetical protein